MWMVNIETLIFMDANEATLLLYGYTRKEFPTMNLKDIRPESELENMQKRSTRAMLIRKPLPNSR